MQNYSECTIMSENSISDELYLKYNLIPNFHLDSFRSLKIFCQLLYLNLFPPGWITLLTQDCNKKYSTAAVKLFNPFV